MNAITNSNYVNYVPVSVSVSSCFIGSRLGLMTPLTAAAYDFGTRYLFSEGCEGRASCNCCEERMSREGGRSSCNCCEEISSREGGRSSCGCFCKQCWYGTMSKENFNVLDMSWTLSWTCPVQVSRPNIPLYSVIIKDSNQHISVNINARDIKHLSLDSAHQDESNES